MRELFWGDGNILCLNCSLWEYRCIYLSELIELYTWNGCILPIRKSYLNKDVQNRKKVCRDKLIHGCVCVIHKHEPGPRCYLPRVQLSLAALFKLSPNLSFPSPLPPDLVAHSSKWAIWRKDEGSVTARHLLDESSPMSVSLVFFSGCHHASLLSW